MKAVYEDLDGNEAPVNILNSAAKAQGHKKLYKFPNQRGEVWICKSDVIETLKPLAAVGTSKLLYGMTNSERTENYLNTPLNFYRLNLVSLLESKIRRKY